MIETNATVPAQQQAQDRAPGYYIVVPAGIWFDARLRPNSTKLYGVVSALCSREGYCWASDGYLGEMLHQSERTVRDLLRELVDCGHLWVDKLEGRRRIWITPPEGENPPGDDAPPDSLAKIRQNAGENPPENNQSNNNITPYSPPGGTEGETDAPDPPQGDKPQRETIEQKREHWFECLWAIYPNHGGRAPALKRWMRMRPSLELARRIYRALQLQIRAGKWSPGYWPELRRWLMDERWNDELPQESGEPGRVQEEEGVVYW